MMTIPQPPDFQVQYERDRAKAQDQCKNHQPGRRQCPGCRPGPAGAAPAEPDCDRRLSSDLGGLHLGSPRGRQQLWLLRTTARAGRPTFVFLDVPPDEEIPVTFDLPSEGPYKGNQLPETLTARPDAGEATTAYYLTTLTSQAAAKPVAPEPAPTELARARPEATVEMWTINRWFTRDIAVSSEECQQAVDLLQSDAAFLAVQVPEPPHLVTESALLPIYYNPAVELIDYDGDFDLTSEAVFRPDRFSFVSNELPAEQGEIWLALGISNTAPLSCPTGLETDNWEIATELSLDLSYVPDDCEGCVLDRYLCYENQSLPGGASSDTLPGSWSTVPGNSCPAATRTASVQNYRDWGITCAGPLPVQFVDPAWNNWDLAGASTQWVTPQCPSLCPTT